MEQKTSKLDGISFATNGAKTETRFRELVTKYLGDQDDIQKNLEGNVTVQIYKKDIGKSEPKLCVNIFDNYAGWFFASYPTELSEDDIKDERHRGVKCSLRTTNFPEITDTLDSRDLDTLEKFLTDNMV